MSRGREIQMFNEGELPQTADDFICLIQDLTKAEDLDDDAASELLAKYNNMIDTLDDQEVLNVVVSAAAIMEQKLLITKAEGDERKAHDLKREIAILHSFLADHVEYYDYAASVRALLELNDNDECVLASMSESLVRHFKLQEKLTEEDGELFDAVEEKIDDFADENTDLAIAYKMRSDVNLAAAIYFQKFEDLDADLVQDLVNEAKQDLLRALSIDTRDTYDDNEICDFMKEDPERVQAVVDDESRWRRS